jgi:hypothetical protein
LPPATKKEGLQQELIKIESDVPVCSFVFA